MTDTGWLYIVHEPERADRSLVAISVRNLEAAVADIDGRGFKTRVAGLTLKATDTDFSVGTGPLVEGPAISLLLAASGRKSALDELSGPGVTILRERS